MSKKSEYYFYEIHNIREEELKNKVGEDWFKNFDTTQIIGNVDFSVFPAQDNLFGRIPLLWAEAKKGDFDVITMFVQLILTIGKARTFDKILPPAFLGAFDFKKMAFVPYINIQDIFYINDFNWNVTPSNHESKEFQLIKERVEKSLKQNAYIFDYEKDEKELKFFIKNNIANASQTAKIKIDKNNFIPIYLRWLEIIKPIININEKQWEGLKKKNIIDADFYIADLFVDDKNTANIEDDTSIRDSLFVIFENKEYKILAENINEFYDAAFKIKNKEIYQSFWKLYKRPPLKEYQEYIIQRRDLLVPQDIRERKGAFFTPRQWVELSQKYLTDVFGENWQDEYYIWDCAAGTGNLLAGLTNKFNIYASTLDQADVNVMHERIEHGANLLKKHCFQFDFLNDEFIPQSKGGKLPDSLFDIISNEEKRKKLVVYINPPYAESGLVKDSQGKKGVQESRIHRTYKKELGKVSRELFAQFLIRIYKEIPQSKLGEFSTLKILQAPNSSDFRKNFRAKLEKIFLTPANTFDNVKGEFPIGFKIWNTEKKETFKYIEADIYNKKAEFIGTKNIYCYDNDKFINEWLDNYIKKLTSEKSIGFLNIKSNDFQHNNRLLIGFENALGTGDRHRAINQNNLSIISIYFAVRHCIPADWLNDRDQFLYPNEGWQTDTEFQNDCLAFTLFHGQNRITSVETQCINNNVETQCIASLQENEKKINIKTQRINNVQTQGINNVETQCIASLRQNHWIPFTEQEVDAKERFESHFMTDFIKGKIHSSPNPSQGRETNSQLAFEFEKEKTLLSFGEGQGERKFSEEAQAVFDAGRELWRYYHAQENANPNASLYDIRKFFQGENEKGHMNKTSEDEQYNLLITTLREKLKDLADKIKPKVFEYGFLRR